MRTGGLASLEVLDLRESCDRIFRVNDAYDDQVDALSHGWNAGPKASIFDVV